MAASDLRKIFLQQFVREILLHASKQQPYSASNEKKPDLSSFKETETEKTEEETSPTSVALAQSDRPFSAPRVSWQKPRQLAPFPPESSPRQLPYKMSQILLHRRPLPPKVYLAPPTESWLVTMPSLSRIHPLLTDLTITTVECPGSGMPIMIARGAYVQSTPVHFTADEIKEIIQEVSSRTKIPLNASGVFTASIGDVIITAVLSEFVGTRFIIQRKPKAPKAPSNRFPQR